MQILQHKNFAVPCFKNIKVTFYENVVYVLYMYSIICLGNLITKMVMCVKEEEL